LHYSADAAVLTSIEFDHADIYRNLDHVRSAFGKFVTAMAPRSLLVHVDDDPNVTDIVGSAGCNCQSYGTMPDSNWQLDDIVVDPPPTRFRAIRDGRDFGTFKTRMIGRHNLKNILAAIAVADHLGVPQDIIADALERFAGVKRRQEIRGEKRGILVIDDFAHHPTAVR
jgi:UDP-N-acetylmuramate: L-alanyl-gamma-D-glutamyl-meso-diaminopimelate ligase